MGKDWGSMGLGSTKILGSLRKQKALLFGFRRYLPRPPIASFRDTHHQPLSPPVVPPFGIKRQVTHFESCVLPPQNNHFLRDAMINV